MDRSINAFLRFPFNPPAYVFERLATDDGTAFHVRRCPVADYFRAHSAPDLCVGTWCNLDGSSCVSGGWRDQQFNQRTQQRFSPFTNIVNELE